MRVVSVADLTGLLDGIERAPTAWLTATIEHLDQIRRADVICRGEHWELCALQADAARVSDSCSLSLADASASSRAETVPRLRPAQQPLSL